MNQYKVRPFISVDIGYIPIFADGHEYVKSKLQSTGDFTIKGTMYNEFKLRKSINKNGITWIVNKKGTAYNESPVIHGANRYEAATKISREGWKAVKAQAAKTVI